MALVHADFVQETSTTTGTGAYDLAGAVAGFRTFVAGIGNGNTCLYAVKMGSDWEVGIGTVTDGAPDTLARTTVLASSNAGAAVNWGAGTKTIICSVIAPQFYSKDQIDTLLAAKQATNADLTDLIDRWIAASASGPASLDFLEDTDNGANRVRVQAPAAVTSDRTFTLPDETGIPAMRDVADQQITGGARITTLDLGNLSGATITPDPGDRPIQKITNNGAGTIAPGSNQGSYLLVVKNTTGAGAITTSGWQDVSGDAFDTTTTSEFLCLCTVVADFSSLQILKVA